MIFKQQLTNISTVLNNTGDTTKLLTSFNTLDIAQQKVLLSSSLLSEKQKEQCITMATMSAANTKYTAEQLVKATGISTETLANWGLIESTDSLTISQLTAMASSDAQAKTVLDKIIAQNAQAIANDEVTTSNIALGASETGTTLATGAFTTAIKANITAIKTWLLSTPAGWLTMLAGGIFIAVKAYNALTVSVEEQKEKMDNSLSSYDDAKSKLSNITTELKTQEQAMDDLLKKEKLTYAEKGQLEELQAITQELRVQKDLAAKEKERAQKEVATDASDLFKKQFNGYDISANAINEYQKNADITGNNVILVSDKNNISAMIAGYKQFNKLLDEVYGESNQEDIDHFKSLTDDLKDSIFSTAQDLQKQQDNISDYYNTIKDTPYKDLTTEKKEIVDSYNTISEAIALIYKQLDPNTWKSMQIENVFDTEDIEKTKEELIEMAKEGTLDESTIQSYPKLSDALERNKVSANELCTELQTLADREKEVQDSTLDDESDKLSFETLIESAESASDAVSALRSSISTLNDAFAEQKEKGSISVDTMLSLVEAGYATALQFDAATGACTINTQAMYALVKSKIENQMQDLKILKTEIAGKLREEGVIANASAEGFINLAKAKFADAEATALQQKQSIEDFNSAEAQILALENALKNYDKVQVGDYSTSFTSSADSATKAVEDAAQATKDYIEAYMDFQKESLEAGKIGYNTYCNSVSELLNSMYQDGKISAQDYHNYIGQMLDEQLSIYDKALSAVTRRIDKEIDGIEAVISSIEKQNDALQNQLDDYDTILSVVDSVYEAEIDRVKAQQDAIQDNIDALQDENDERELALQLEQAKYDLYRAQTQRTKKVFNGTEFVYETDQDAIREAQENLADLTLEQTISGLETEKDALDSVIEELEYYQSLWAEISTAKETENNRQLAIALWGENYESFLLSNRISDINAFKDSYISIQDQINDNEGLIASYEEKIEYYEALKEQWSSISDAYEQTQEDQYAAMLLGQNWEAEVLSGRTDTLNQFKDDYISIQQAIIDAAWASANEQIKAAQEAEKAASGTTGNGEKLYKAPSVPNPEPDSTMYRIVDTVTGGTLVYSSTSEGNAKQKLAALNAYEPDQGRYYIKKYAAGTTHARRGVNLVGEDGTETYIDNDGNIALVTKPTLIPMEGGETVKNAAETKSLLDMDNLVPVDTFEFTGIDGEKIRLNADELQQRVLSIMPNYSSVVQPPMMQTPRCDILPVQNNTTPVVQNITLTLPNVTNTSGYERIQKELKQMQIDAYQFAHKR